MTVGEKFATIRSRLKLSATAFGAPMGIKKAQMSAIESGKSQTSAAVIKLMLQHYRVSNHWWETGEGEMFEPATDATRPPGAFDIPRPTGKIPIISWAQAGPDGFFEDSHPAGAGFGEINRPYDISDPNAYALIISGESMAPKYEPGDVILVSPNMGVQTGDYAVARLRDGTVAAKKVKAKNGRYILESINPDYPDIDCSAEDVIFLHRIVWVKQRG